MILLASNQANLFHDLKQTHQNMQKIYFYIIYFVKEKWQEKCKEFKNVKCLSCSDHKY